MSFYKRFILLTISILITAIFCGIAQNNTISISRKWKIDIIYSDSIPVIDTNIYHLRYQFIPNGSFVMEDVFEKGSLTGNWQWTGNMEFRIYKEDKEIQKGKIVYLDPDHLIFTYKGKHVNSNKEANIEYRMVPDL